MQYKIGTSVSKMSFLLIALVAGLTGCSETKEQEITAAAEETATEAVPTNVAYISSQKAGISQVDLATMSVIKTLDPKAKSPRGIGITEDGRYLIVATRENSSISIIDTITGEVAKQIPVGKNPEFVRVKGNYAFISSEPSAVGGPPPKPGAHEEEEDEDDDDEDALPAKIAVVDLKAGEKVREITGGPETEGIEFSADGKFLVITNEADNTITVHNIETGELVKTIQTEEYGKRPRGIKLSPSGDEYIATLEFGNQYLVLDKEFNVTKAVNTGETPYGVAYDEAGKLIYVATNRGHQLQVYDATTHEQVKTAESGKRCWHFSFTPDNQKIMLACGKSDDVYVYNTEDLSLSTKIDVPGMPWGVLTYPKAMGSLDTK